MSSIIKVTQNFDKRIFLLIFGIVFTVFLFTSDGHRYTLDEDMAHQQTTRLATLTPHPLFFEGESKMLFEYSQIWPVPQGPVCINPIFCSAVRIGHTLTQVPLFLINHVFQIITTENYVITNEHFDNIPYVFWRNDIDPNLTFMEIFYGPIFSSLSVAVFFLICRTFNFSSKISLVLTFLFGFTSMIWAYSNTSLNSVPATTFILIGYLFFKKFQNTHFTKFLVFSGISLGFSFLTRTDAVLFIIPLFFLLLYELSRQGKKIKKFFSFIIPTSVSYAITNLMEIVNYGVIAGYQTPGAIAAGIHQSNPPLAILGLLLSPGVGLLIFSPILFTIFFSFLDFYKRNKKECILFLSFVSIFLIYFGNQVYWHGLNAWGPRYLLPIIAFMLIPLGASLENRKSKFFKIILLTLGSFGVLFNLVYVLQDVSYFVWSFPYSGEGLFHLGTFGNSPLSINDLVLWTFEFSQLTHAITLAFTHLQPDISLLIILGPIPFITIFVAIITILVFYLIKNFKKIEKTLSP